LIARDGGDPIAQRRQANRTVLTFKEAVKGARQPSKGWKNPKHRDQWINTLRDYAFGKFGAKRVNAVTTADVLQVLTPIWLEKPETARRVRQRMRAVLDWAKAAGHRDGDNPVEGVGDELPRQKDKAEHHAALPYADLNPFLTALHASGANDATKLALEFLILTAMRTGEVIGAKWSEIDTRAKTWTIPKERMKAQREHRVPLSERCMAILKQARTLSGESYIFPGVDHDTPLSNMAFLTALRRMGCDVCARIPWGVPRLGRRAYDISARSLRSCPRTFQRRQSRGRLSSQRPIRAAARADESMGYACGIAGQARQGVAHGSAQGMTNQRDFDAQSPIVTLSRRWWALVLPAPVHELIPKLTDMVSGCRGVAQHRGKLWGELTEGEENIVAARVGVIAHEIIRRDRAEDADRRCMTGA
jgi:integrase